MNSTIIINRRCGVIAVAINALAQLVLSSFVSAQSPWLTNAPIVDVRKELYIKHTQPGVGVLAEQYLTGPKGQRIELRAVQATDDQGTEMFNRFSADNGRTWTEPEPAPNTDITHMGVHVFEANSAAVPFYDPHAQVTVQPWLRQVIHDNSHYNHVSYKLSVDFGRTCSASKQLKYEEGAEFDPNNPLDPNYLHTNNAYVGVDIVIARNGALVFGVGATKAPSGGPKPGSRLFGAINFVGTWNGKTGTAADYTWQASNRVAIASSYSASNPTNPVSGRGLVENATALLRDGRILDVMRGSNKFIVSAGQAAAGHKWYTISTNNGLKLGEVQELKYDDGTSFYSPSSPNRLIRSEANGKLYLIGNISPTVPRGNMPRYPLVIAEIDEQAVAVKKSTVTVIEDRQPDEPTNIQFSNFSLLQNPETQELELFLSNYGVDGAASGLGGDSYKYTLTLKKPGD